MTSTERAEAGAETLAEQAAATRNEFLASVSEQTRATFGAAFQKLMESDVAADAMGVGDAAPDFTLPNVHGGELPLSQALGKGPVVLSFYRGGWCPFCNLEFRALQAHLPEMEALGATLIGISPETPDNSLTTAEKNDLRFEVLSDVGNRVAREYGLVMTVYEELRPLYLEWGLDIPAANGDDSWELPVPATYVIDTDGIISAAYVNKDYTQRMEPTDIVAALRALDK